MESKEQTAIRLLTELVGFQNGAPLDRHKEEYDKLMNEIYAFIDSYSPTTKQHDTLQEGDWFQGTEEEYRKVLEMEMYKLNCSYDVDEILILMSSEGFCVYNGLLLESLETEKITKLPASEFLRRAENTFKNR